MKGFKGFARLAVVMLTIFALLLSGCAKNDAQPTSGSNVEPKEEEFKVAFVYVGPVGDAGWTYAHDMGKKYLEEQVPNVKTTIVEAVKEGPEAETVLTQLAEQGNKVIFATSFGYMDYVQKVAAKYPDVVFLHCSGYKTAENVGTYFGRMYQPRYLSGLVAGSKTEKDVIGYVAAFPIPEVIRGINAFTLGVREVNPDAKVKVVWTNTWYDPATEKEAAISLLDSGADVIAMHQDTPGPMQAAEEKGAFAISYNTDMSQFAPKAVMTGPVWNWGPYYAETVKAVIEGTWKSDQYWGPMSDGITDLAPFGDMVPAEVKQLVEDKKQAIIKGEFDVFQGPIKDQSGAEKVPAGGALTDEEMLSLDWFVEGVEGSLQ